jgi:glycerol-3-phosphate dehydrogenase
MYSPRRTILDLLLVEAARAAGAEIREATTFRELIWEDNRVVGASVQDREGVAVEESATVVVGADGMWSPGSSCRLCRDRDKPRIPYMRILGPEYPLKGSSFTCAMAGISSFSRLTRA